MWVLLVALGTYGALSLRGTGLLSLLTLAAVGGISDLVFQRARFDRLRVPDASLATGAFVALILPPAFPIAASAATVLVAIGSKHVLRSLGHPWFNPAALAVGAAALLFGAVPAWWVAVGPLGTYLAPAFGLALIALGASRWRLPATFLVAYGALATLQHVVIGASVGPSVLLLQAIDPVTLFFAFFMVAEPGTSPGDSAGQVLYAGVVGVFAAFAPILSPTFGLVVALLAGNVLGVSLRYRDRSAHSDSRRDDAPRTRRKARSAGPRSGVRAPWSVGRRAAAGLAVLVVVVALAAAYPASWSGGLPPGGGTKGATTETGCSSDNPAIPAATLADLHARLGPSVIRSYNSTTGVVVFYDPVNRVTVTETDLFEDFGYAEFNGDDFAVSGCS